MRWWCPAAAPPICARSGQRVVCAGAPAGAGCGRRLARVSPAAGASGCRGPAPAPDLADVRGQWQAKRALLIAAAGGHSLLMQGPPGSGKTMLAQRLPGLLPALLSDRGTGGRGHRGGGATAAGHARRTVLPTAPPFRAPHHTASAHAIVGGGKTVQPGEVSLAHHGVLFLDELPEFDRRVLESAARTAGIRAGQRGARQPACRLSRLVSAGGGDESLSLRPRRAGAAALPLPAGADLALPRAHLGAAAGSHRPAAAAGGGGCRASLTGSDASCALADDHRRRRAGWSVLPGSASTRGRASSMRDSQAAETLDHCRRRRGRTGVAAQGCSGAWPVRAQPAPHPARGAQHRRPRGSRGR